MALTTLASVQLVPGLGSTNSLLTPAYLQQLVDAADSGIKLFLKWKVEQATYVHYFSGKNETQLVLRVPWAVSITNLWVDANGNFGQTSGAFGSGTLLASGTNYALEMDTELADGTPVSERSLVQMLGGGPLGTWPWPWWGGLNRGKLAGSPGPTWPLGRGNIKVEYVAGFETVPADLQYAANMLVADMVRNQPSGTPLNNESLGAYSYGVAQMTAEGQYPTLSSIGPILRRYREQSF